MLRAKRSPRGPWALLAAAAILIVSASPARSENWETVATQSKSILVEEDTRLKNLDPIVQQLFLPDANKDLKLTSILQLFPVDPELLGAGPVRKAKGRARIGCQGNLGQRNLGTKTRKFDRQGNAALSRTVDANANCEFFFVDWDFLKNFEIPEGTSIEALAAIELVDPDADPDCFGTDTLCLNDDRFKVEVEWRDFAGQSGVGTAFPRTDDSGTFFFFDPNNTELLLKVLDGCQRNDHYWVFFGALTNVEFEVTVTDTLTNQSRVYDNPLGRPAPAIVDTQAFATCP